MFYRRKTSIIKYSNSQKSIPPTDNLDRFNTSSKLLTSLKTAVVMEIVPSSDNRFGSKKTVASLVSVS